MATTGPFPVRHNLVLYQGETYNALNWSFVYKAGSPATPVNLTGYTAFLDVRASQDPTSTLITQFNTGNGYLVLGGALGSVTPAVPSSVTIALVTGVYWYDLWLNSPANVDIHAFLYGQFIVQTRVTNSV